VADSDSLFPRAVDAALGSSEGSLDAASKPGHKRGIGAHRAVVACAVGMEVTSIDNAAAVGIGSGSDYGARNDSGRKERRGREETDLATNLPPTKVALPHFDGPRNERFSFQLS
jgi:hypothetical protein